MKAKDKVLQVYPEATCVQETGRDTSGSQRFTVYLRVGARTALGVGNQERRAWAEAWRAIERAGTHHKCPYCKVPLIPFMGEEDGPVTAWAHPKRSTGCPWSEFEGLTKRQITMAAGAGRAGRR